MFRSLFVLAFVAVLNVATAAPTPTVDEGAGTLSDKVGESTSSIMLDLYGWTYSNAFANFNGRKATAYGAPGDPVQIATQLILHAPAFGSMDFTLVPQFILQPFQGERFQLLNPTVGIQGVVAESGNFSYWARYEFALPLLDKSRAEGMVAAPAAVQTFAYKFPNSRFKAEAVIIPSVTFFNNGEASGFLYLSPRLYYSINDSWQLVGLFEAAMSSSRTAELVDLVPNAPGNFGLGARFTAKNGTGLWVQPFLDFYPSGRVLETAHLGVFFGGPLL